VVNKQGRNLVFILSTPRAGSTLLAALLGSHSRILCPPEPWLLLHLSVIGADEHEAIVISRYDHAMAHKALHELVDSELLREAKSAFAVTIYNSLLDQAGKQVFVDKTPRYYHILPWLDAMFPLAQKIWIKRNPLDVIASRKDRGFSIEETVGHALSQASFDTTISFALLASYFEAEAPTKYVIRYEDLVQNTLPHVKAICKFLGLSFEESMLDYGTNQHLMNAYAGAAMGDPKLLTHVRPHTHSVGRWRDSLTPGEIREVLQALGHNLFMRLGYGDILKEAAAQAGLVPEEIHERGSFDRIYEEYGSYVDRELLIPSGIQHTRLARQFAGLMRQTGQLQQRNAQLQDRNAQLQDRNAQLQDRNAQLQEEDVQLQGRITWLEEQNSQLHTQTTWLRAQIEHCAAQLDQMHTSWSWRITAPLRRILGILRG
jgi:hypothetical protein